MPVLLCGLLSLVLECKGMLLLILVQVLYWLSFLLLMVVNPLHLLMLLHMLLLPLELVLPLTMMLRVCLIVHAVSGGGGRGIVGNMIGNA